MLRRLLVLTLCLTPFLPLGVAPGSATELERFNEMGCIGPWAGPGYNQAGADQMMHESAHRKCAPDSATQISLTEHLRDGYQICSQAEFVCETGPSGEVPAGSEEFRVSAEARTEQCADCRNMPLPDGFCVQKCGCPPKRAFCGSW